MNARDGDRRALARAVSAGLTVLLVLVMLVGLGWGAADTDVISALLARFGLAEASLRDLTIVWDIRAPRVLTGALVGAGLAVSGAILQGLFRNPLADPGLIGISAGSALAAVGAIVLGTFLPQAIQALTGIYLIPVAAFLGGWASTILLYRISTRRGQTSVATMLLAGIALGAMTGALTGLITYYADDGDLRRLTFWSMGSLAGATWAKLIVAGPVIALALLGAPFLARALNALTLGEATARHLGIPVQKMKRIAILCVAGSVGASVAITGGIGFVGIVVPHLLRLLHGPDHRGLLINAGLLGAVVLVLADMVSRTIIAPAELPIGIITAAIGGPFFLWILLRNRSILEM
ncbi:iron ABC transporter permease [Roseovarius aestuarii]|nr:iron ABC transporter permease [Roseovarius aestuarii]